MNSQFETLPSVYNSKESKQKLKYSGIPPSGKSSSMGDHNIAIVEQNQTVISGQGQIIAG